MARRVKPVRNMTNDEKKTRIMDNAYLDVGFIDSRIVLRSLMIKIRAMGKEIPETGTVRKELDQIKVSLEDVYHLIDMGEKTNINKINKKKEITEKIINEINRIKKEFYHLKKQ